MQSTERDRENTAEKGMRKEKPKRNASGRGRGAEM